MILSFYRNTDATTKDATMTHYTGLRHPSEEAR
jgi:hypothetical protein